MGSGKSLVFLWISTYIRVRVSSSQTGRSPNSSPAEYSTSTLHDVAFHFIDATDACYYEVYVCVGSGQGLCARPLCETGTSWQYSDGILWTSCSVVISLISLSLTPNLNAQPSIGVNMYNGFTGIWKLHISLQRISKSENHSTTAHVQYLKDQRKWLL